MAGRHFGLRRYRDVYVDGDIVAHQDHVLVVTGMEPFKRRAGTSRLDTRVVLRARFYPNFSGPPAPPYPVAAAVGHDRATGASVPYRLAG